jgi:hypothetical protein
MSFRDMADVGRNTAFIDRVMMAMLREAQTVSTEDAATPGHAQRAQWATQVARDPAHYAARMALAVASDPNTSGVGLDSSDADLWYTVKSLWNLYAGVILPEVTE